MPNGFSSSVTVDATFGIQNQPDIIKPHAGLEILMRSSLFQDSGGRWL
jgi:hypothetical protein